MSRTGKVRKRVLAEEEVFKTDPKHKHPLIAKFINTIMRNGKKTVAQSVMYKALDILKEKNEDPIQVFERAIENISPRMEVKPRRIGGASYQVPQEVRAERRVALAVRWIKDAATKRSNKEYHTFSAKLAQEILDASQNQGEAIKKRDLMQRMADANRAFAHFRW